MKINREGIAKEIMSDTKNSNVGGTTVTESGPNTVKLTFLPSGQSVEFENGKLEYQEHGKRQSILDVAMNFGIHLEHACGGSCACTTCHVVVKKGKELLSEASEE